MSKTSVTRAQQPPNRLAALALATTAWLVACTIISLFFIANYSTFNPDFEAFVGKVAEPKAIAGRSFSPVSGAQSYLRGSSIFINVQASPRAIVSAPTSFIAENYPFVSVDARSINPYSQAYLVWRMTSTPNTLHRMLLNKTADGGVTQVAMASAGQTYRGAIEELAVVFIPDTVRAAPSSDESVIELRGVELLPYSFSNIARQIVVDWTNRLEWPGHVNNVVRGMHLAGLAYPNAIFSLITITALILVFAACKVGIIKTSPAATLRTSLLTVLILSFAVMEGLQWSNRFNRISDVNERYLGRTLEERIIETQPDAEGLRRTAAQTCCLTIDSVKAAIVLAEFVTMGSCACKHVNLKSSNPYSP